MITTIREQRFSVNVGGQTRSMTFDEVVRKHVEMFSCVSRSRAALQVATAEWGWVLLQMKRQLPHGEFMPFLDAAGVHQKAANRAMSIGGRCVRDGQFCPEMVPAVMKAIGSKRKSVAAGADSGRADSTHVSNLMTASGGSAHGGARTGAVERAAIDSFEEPEEDDASFLRAAVGHLTREVAEGRGGRLTDDEAERCGALGIGFGDEIAPEGWKEKKLLEVVGVRAVGSGVGSSAVGSGLGGGAAPPSGGAPAVRLVTQLTLEHEYALAARMRDVAGAIDRGEVPAAVAERIARAIEAELRAAGIRVGAGTNEANGQSTGSGGRERVGP